MSLRRLQADDNAPPPREALAEGGLPFNGTPAILVYSLLDVALGRSKAQRRIVIREGGGEVCQSACEAELSSLEAFRATWPSGSGDEVNAI